jgi:hypothetical protein
MKLLLIPSQDGESQMKFATGLAMAGFIALGTSGMAAAQDMMMTSPMQCMAACNAGYQQCLSAGTDTTLKATPQEGLATIVSNGQNWTACAQQAFQCNATCG